LAYLWKISGINAISILASLVASIGHGITCLQHYEFLYYGPLRHNSVNFGAILKRLTVPEKVSAPPEHLLHFFELWSTIDKSPESVPAALWFKLTVTVTEISVN